MLSKGMAKNILEKLDNALTAAIKLDFQAGLNIDSDLTWNIRIARKWFLEEILADKVEVEI